jgi:formylglycine-generating enzyme
MNDREGHLPATQSAVATAATNGMKLVQGGSFRMGSEAFYPEERPLRRVKVDSFWIDETPVTNREFARFVKAAGHVTLAEVAPDPDDYPGIMPEYTQPGSLVFNKTAGPVPMNEYHHWWNFTIGANWRPPVGARERSRPAGSVGIIRWPM